MLNFLEDVRFDRLGAFMYSREEDTQAYKLQPQINHNTKKRRFREVMEQQKRIANGLNKRFLDKELEVIIEEKDSKLSIGRSQYDAPEVDGAVFLKRSGLKIGNFYKTKIVDCLDYDLVGI